MFLSKEANKYVVIFGAMLSLTALIALLFDKFSSSSSMVFVVKSMWFVMLVFSVFTPVLLAGLRVLHIKQIFFSTIFLIILYVDLFLWVLIFNGFAYAKMVFFNDVFLLPLLFFFISTGICLILPYILRGRRK
jgi:hypothetical protein